MERTEPLSTQQRAVLTAILAWAEAHGGNTPSVRTVAAQLGRSYSTTRAHLQRLEEKGYVTWRDGRLVVLRGTRTRSND